MGEQATILISNYLDDAHLGLFGQRLAEWLVADLNRSDESVPVFTESRAKALLRASGFIDDPTLNDFGRLVEGATAVRLALYDLLDGTGLVENNEVRALAAASNAFPISQSPNPSTGSGQVSQSSISWLSLAIAAHAWKSEYPLYQLDPAAPPGEHSPAGQLLRRAANFIRQQVQRSATEREKWGRKLAYAPGDMAAQTPSLDQLLPQSEIAPVPPYFRSPVPVRYPEYARETLRVEPEPPLEPLPPTPAPVITISEGEVTPPAARPITMPPIQITEDQIPRVVSTSRRPSAPSSGSSGNLNTAVQQRFGSKEPMRAVKLRIVVQEYQDGPGLYGLQVKVSCQGVKAFVAGTTNRDGVFLCELPVRVRSGLTYDVDVTWPRDFGSETERKSITLNVDRTEFTLPFYHRLSS
ncbi:MAG: hypothetical protein HND44_04270 [Chloroflexi bacterium]|nr:hypothetical protein [Ardenticatenaceae bacterium]MBL1127715.1 hypothetical protein [Chloroflexota bacterium]NOG33781.1 hypothetical protein [Chloroflexota bacterium]GIK54365.1 MAG: hypothetical protein BroJett015_00280 [Chloroflexota bacterium]